MIEYMTLKLIWWGIFCFLSIAFSVTGGMDIGASLLLPIVGKSDDERRLILNSIGPTWEGNQVWLITLGAGAFAIWPVAYATIFSSMYYTFMLVLLMLIIRPPGIDYRGKINSHTWRTIWDTALFTSNLLLAFSFGLVLGNFYSGLPFYFDPDMRLFYDGSLLNILSPCGLIFGITSLCIFGLQGALLLQYRLSNHLAKRARMAGNIFGIAFIIMFVISGIFVALWVAGYQIIDIPDLNIALSINAKIVQPVTGWLLNYANNKILWIFPILTLLAVRIAMRLANKGYTLYALYMNSFGIMCAVLTASSALFPFILPSSSNPNQSLTLWDVSSSPLTLEWALFAVVILLPLVLFYSSWAYKVMRGKVKLAAESY